MHDFNDSHRCRIATTLTMVDKAICEFEQWIEGREANSVLYREHNDIDPTQRQRIGQRVSMIRQLLEKLKSDLDLESSQQESTSIIAARCATLWSNVIDLGPRSLRKYGPVTSSASDYLDVHIAEIVEQLDGISLAVSHSAE